MTNNNHVIVDLYVVVHEANNSFQSLNRVIRKYNYEIELIPLDIFEKKFRRLFNLKTYDEQIHQQNIPIKLKKEKNPDKEIFISEEFFDILSAYADNNPFIKLGYVTLLKTRKVFSKSDETGKTDHSLIIQDLEKMKKFTERLESSLHFARYGYVEFHTLFAKIVDEKRIIPLVDTTNPVLFGRNRHFVEKDNALIEALLNIDCRISDHVHLSIKAFEESFHIRNLQVRFIHLINCLEICFSTSLSEVSISSIARYCAVLMASNKSEFITYYGKMIRLCGLKKDMLSGALSGGTFTEKGIRFGDELFFLEEITRNVIKKVLYLNCKNKDELFYKLDLKTLPGQFGHAEDMNENRYLFPKIA